MMLTTLQLQLSLKDEKKALIEKVNEKNKVSNFTEDEINKHVRLQADIAAEEADFLILLVDGRSELTSSEKILADLIIATEKPFILVANKVDDIVHEQEIFSLYELGMGDPMPVSAQSGRSLGDLLDVINTRLPERLTKKKISDEIINLAIANKEIIILKIGVYVI